MAEFATVAKERNRMCKTYNVEAHEGSLTCRGCPINVVRVGKCRRWIFNNPELAEPIIMNWGRAHPRRTYLDQLKEDHPTAIHEDVVAGLCPMLMGYRGCHPCTMPGVDNAQIECWNQEMREEEGK